MSTLNFTLDLDAVDEIIGVALRRKWIRALKKSRQFLGGMADSFDESHCCMCVLHKCEFPESTFEDYEMKPTAYEGNSFKLREEISVECGNTVYTLETLNDDLMTHEEIRTLLRTGTMTIDDPAKTHEQRVKERNQKLPHK